MTFDADQVEYRYCTSWTITSARLLSPASRVGVAKVRQGFSIPPYGNEGGRHRTLKWKRKQINTRKIKFENL